MTGPVIVAEAKSGLISSCTIGNEMASRDFSDDMAHLILTRFNVHAFSNRGLGTPSPTWMEHRFGVFERFCLPSVAAQTVQNFRWIIFVHPSTNPNAIGRLNDLRKLRNFELCFTERCDVPFLSKLCSPWVAADGSLITTRLDNDDALHSDYALRVQTHLKGKEPRWLNFDHGLQVGRRGLYRYQHLSNAFLSRIEFGPRVETALLERHSDVVLTDDVEHVTGYRAWLQVVHGKNVANTISKRSKLVSIEVARDLLTGYCQEVREGVESIYSKTNPMTDS